MRWCRSSAQGRERFAQGFWIVIYPEGTRIPVGQARAVQDGRRAPRDRDAGPDPADRAQRRLAVAEGRHRQAAGRHHDVDRQADRAGMARTPPTADAGGRDVDRGRSRAARASCMSAAAGSRRRDGAHQPPASSCPTTRSARGRADRATSAVQSRRIVLAGAGDRLPADPRAAPLDRHGGASRRAHRARAALGDAARHRAGARGARAMDRPVADRMARAAARRHAARMEVRRADPVPRRASSRSRFIRRERLPSRPICST